MVDPQNVDWADIKEKLPYRKNDVDKDKRTALWKGIDINGNGVVSLAEMDKGLRDAIQLEVLFDSPKVLMRAFQKSKNAVGSNKTYGDDYIERKELRYILKYLRRYFEYWVAYARLSADNDVLNLDEFVANIGEVEKWNVEFDDPEALFKQIDKNGKGKILFDEWVEWADSIKLDIDDDDDNVSADEDEPPKEE